MSKMTLVNRGVLRRRPFSNMALLLSAILAGVLSAISITLLRSEDDLQERRNILDKMNAKEPDKSELIFIGVIRAYLWQVYEEALRR